MKRIAFILAILCFISVCILKGLELQTTDFDNMASKDNWAKTIILEGYVYLADVTTYLPNELYGFETDYIAKSYVPVLIEDSAGLLANYLRKYRKVPSDKYVLLDFDKGRFFLLEKGDFKARIKGTIVIRDCNRSVITLDVIKYGLALQEKIYLKAR